MQDQLAKRKSIRLPGFDYSQAGAYFVTICSFDRKCIFGNIVDTIMHPNQLGSLIDRLWQVLPKVRPSISLDRWIVMPNHLHGILWLEENNSNDKSLSTIMCSFKSNSTSQARKVFGPKINLWQRGFYEHIIRDEKDLFRIRQYIEDNPMQWTIDEENPDFFSRAR